MSRLWLIAALIIGLSACSNDDEGGDDNGSADNNIAEIVSANSEFSSLLAALQKTGLDATFATDQGSFTVFAPTNAAFDAYLDGASIDDVDNDVLTALLLNHVLTTAETAADLETGYYDTAGTYASTTNAIDLFVQVNGGAVTVNGGSAVDGGANVTQADLEATNGVIHIVDAVIELPTITTFASVDSTFSTLLTALTREDTPDFGAILARTDEDIDDFDPPFTVFAPTNEAFAALLLELDPSGNTTLEDIDGDTLTAALLLHVITAANVTADDLEEGNVQTAGGTITINLGANPTIIDPDGRMSEIILTDVQTSNGVIHAIDTVLLPASGPSSEPQ